MSQPATIFVTGATGLIGRELVDRFLDRNARVTVLVRPESLAHAGSLIDRWRAAEARGSGTLSVVLGDITAPRLGLDPELSREVSREVSLARFEHIFHCAALYDLDASRDELMKVNVEGTRELIATAQRDGFQGVLHMLGSVAVAGDLDRTLRETELEVGQGHPHPYQRSKYEAERLVRAIDRFRYRIYRPSAVVGHSKTGAMTKADGPYYLFAAIKKLRDSWPRWLPLTSTYDTTLNMVPVDYVADAIDHLAFAPGSDVHDGSCFHVVDPRPPRFRDTFNLIARAAGAPELKGRGLLGYVPRSVRDGLGSLAFMRGQMLRDLGIPQSIAKVDNRKVGYDTSVIDAALAGTGIACPPQSEYIANIWDFWLRNLDPERDPLVRNRAYVGGRTVVITGASSGVGEALARACARAGANVILVARRAEELQRVVAGIRASGGTAHQYACDLSDLAACDGLIESVLAEHGVPDVLCNNAARSIRRPIVESLDRYHDFERVMQLNYFAPVRLMRGFVPGMRARGSGHIVNVLTAGVAMPTPLFGVYGASKAALAHLTDSMNAELVADGLCFTGVYLGWVRTPMMDATGLYKDTKAMTPEQAADWMLEGMARRQSHIMSGATRRRWIIRSLAPRTLSRIVHAVLKISDSSGENPEFAMDRALLQRFVKGRLI